jgi:protein DGCR14
MVPPCPLANSSFLRLESRQQEDEYTASLSHIIKRDFFPTLPRLAATNAYLTALESQDSQALASSIRHLSSLSSDAAGSSTPRVERERRRREAELAEYNGTPYISRTPFGGADLETPLPGYRQREQDERDEQEIKRRKIDTSRGLDVGRMSS